MTRPKRFRGMELSEDDVDNMVRRHLEQHYEPDDFGHYPLRINTVYARAKRLLPLWRAAGLRELQKHAYNVGRDDGLARSPSPWRSLKDDPPTDFPVLVRKSKQGTKCLDIMQWGTRDYGTESAIPEMLRRGWDQWMEVPS